MEDIAHCFKNFKNPEITLNYLLFVETNDIIVTVVSGLNYVLLLLEHEGDSYL